ncbi:aminotransferase class I/II-fold pyridoxal phosphate-dependent enzyme [Streptomonospora sp. S1-112]|uniref:cysteine-S-conjugate beta-lyase n=1 Tax=Streptomonospora mangrovi TaxID=2883123 RepID=A0A9X3NGU9_9ACTN|nr:aminotransferase class I/II-fold pyridoxal phosphate-dependent enzyme [Streptomonospora mangrovi]MDA0563192.1 aminotransferase class I/II-fold pyridoxal phosphate-dependent enzyme [Streptomonospora mangrovi]
MTRASAFDAVTVDTLRERGSLKWTLYGDDSLGAFVAEMDFGTAPPVLEALHAAVDAVDFGYLPPRAAAGLAAACAGWQRDHYGWAVDPDRVRPLADVLNGFEIAVRHFSRPGSPVILPTPAYMPFLSLPAALDRTVIEVPMARDNGRHVLDLDAIDAAFAAGGHLLVLCNPHNPLGRVHTAEELTALSEVVARHGGRVFADEIHAPLTYPGHRHIPYASLSPTTAGHTVTATSASKAWNLPGLKCAQLIISNDADAATVERLGPYTFNGAASLGVAANTAAYTAGGPWLAEVVAYLDGNRRALADLLAEHLPEVRWTAPEGTYLAWLDLRPLGLGDHPARVLRERSGIALVDGPDCGAPGLGHARLNFATPRPILRRIVAGIAEAARRGPA